MKLKKDVVAFIEWCAKEVGKFEMEAFDYNISNEIVFNYIDSFDYGESLGIKIEPQKKIGKYRVDFLVYYEGRIYGEEGIQKRCVVVECDSQSFHERTEKERRYEKVRDRYLQKEGYKVFRFTGLEIIKESMKVASEVISYLTGYHEADILLDSNIED